MGNKMCKKKTDVVDGDVSGAGNSKKSPWKIGNLINRINLKPATWKSETQLNQKQTARLENDVERKGESIFYTKPISKSSDWTDIDLEVPQKDDEHIHLRNPKLSLIFDKEDGTPTPPPRKNNKGSNIREKIGKIARGGLQALQGDRNNQKPVEEPIIVKKKINYVCPACDSDELNHNRDHHHNHSHRNTSSDKDKRKKNLSVVSLPNYTDLKLSVASPDNKTSSKPDLSSSSLSLQAPGGKKLSSSSSTGRLDAYITRCRSFGSLLPQQLKKLKQPPKLDKKEDVTSDDSFGPLEDWDLGLIEHYNPKDTSLPRPRKPPISKKPDSDVLSGIESLIVKEEDLEASKPKPPVRRSESLVKKIAQKSSQQGAVTKAAPEEVCLTPPPSPQPVKVPVPVKRTLKDEPEQGLTQGDKVEHSSLMRILQEFSIKDKQQEQTSRGEGESDLSSLTPSLVEFEKNLNAGNVVEDFINAEKSHTKAVLS